MSSLDPDSHRHCKGPVFQTHHREARKQQGGREAEPIADPTHCLRRAPEPRVARRTLRYPRDRSVVTAQRRRGARQRARERDRTQSRSSTQTFLQGRNRHAKEYDRAQEARLCTRCPAPHGQRYVRLVHPFTAIFCFWFDKSACHKRWYGYDEQGPSPRFGIYGSPR